VASNIVYTYVNVRVDDPGEGVAVVESAKPDIPGTYVYDTADGRAGAPMNRMFMTLRVPANRDRFTADPAAYCDEYGLTAEQKDAVLRRDWPRMMDLGGNLFFVFKLILLDGRSSQYLSAAFTGTTEEEFVRMMVAGGRRFG
jgi:protocatechuate 4,5-dioxygenase alpha chain